MIDPFSVAVGDGRVFTGFGGAPDRRSRGNSLAGILELHAKVPGHQKSWSSESEAQPTLVGALQFR
jgi:hypothetical protein